MSAVSDVAAEPLRRLVGPAARSGCCPTASTSRGGPSGPVTRQPGPLRLVTAMRLAARKRPAALVELVAEAERPAGAGLGVADGAGGGARPAQGRGARRERGLDWVSLPGRVTRDELRERYAAADVYLSPARLESFGIAALEARTVGLAGHRPIRFRHGRVRRRIGVNGLVVSSDSQMAEAIARLAKAPGRGGAHARLERRAPTRAGLVARRGARRGGVRAGRRAGAPMRTNVPGRHPRRGRRADGRAVAEARLGHGEHPEVVLGAAGWAVESPVFATVA